MIKLDKVATLYLAAEYNRFELFCKKKEMDYNESMEIPIVTEVATIIDADNDIDKPVPKKTGMNCIW